MTFSIGLVLLLTVCAMVLFTIEVIAADVVALALLLALTSGFYAGRRTADVADFRHRHVARPAVLAAALKKHYPFGSTGGDHVKWQTVQ